MAYVPWYSLQQAVALIVPLLLWRAHYVSSD